jgi:hypothetical protein
MTNQDINQRKISMTMKFRPLLIKKSSQILVFWNTRVFHIRNEITFQKIKLHVLHKFKKST